MYDVRYRSVSCVRKHTPTGGYVRRVQLALPAAVITAASLTLTLTGTASASAAQASGVVAATGSVVNAQGAPQAGVQVQLLAWPRSSVLRKLHDGQHVPTITLGSARTTASGHYTVSVPSLTALKSAADNGVVNLEVQAMNGGAFGSFSFSRRLQQPTNGFALGKANPGTMAGPQAATIHLMGSQNAATPQQGAPCGWTQIKTFKPSWTKLESTFSTMSHTTENFTYTQGSSSNLGVGVSSTGKKGSFTGEGSAAFSSTATQHFAPRGGKTGVDYETEFIRAESGFHCATAGPATKKKKKKYISYRVQTVSYAGGTKGVKAKAPKATWCVHYEKNSGYEKSTTSAFEFSTGYTIPVLGLSLSAQTGYDTDAKTNYHFGQAGYLCGTAAYPAQSSKRLVAQSHS